MFADLLHASMRLFQVVKQSDSDKVLIIGAGITLVHAMEAAKELAGAGINARVIDPFTIKPLDQEGIIANAKAAGGKIITVEDHYPEGKIWNSFRIFFWFRFLQRTSSSGEVQSVWSIVIQLE